MADVSVLKTCSSKPIGHDKYKEERFFKLGDRVYSYAQLNGVSKGGKCTAEYWFEGLRKHSSSWTIPKNWSWVWFWTSYTPKKAGKWQLKIKYNGKTLRQKYFYVEEEEKEPEPPAPEPEPEPEPLKEPVLYYVIKKKGKGWSVYNCGRVSSSTCETFFKKLIEKKDLSTTDKGKATARVALLNEDDKKDKEKHNRIYGTVRGNLNLPLAFVKVEFGGKTSTTDKNGFYEIKDIWISGKITVSLFGYADYSCILTAPVSGDLKHDISMSQIPPSEPEPEHEEEKEKPTFTVDIDQFFNFLTPGDGSKRDPFILRPPAPDRYYINNFDKDIWVYKKVTGENLGLTFSGVKGSELKLKPGDWYVPEDTSIITSVLGLIFAGVVVVLAPKLILKYGSGLKHSLVGTGAGVVGNVATKTAALVPRDISYWVKIMVIWNVATDWVWIQNMLRDLGAYITGDVEKRGNSLRYSISNQMKEMNNKINFAEGMQDWEFIKSRMDVLEPLLVEYELLLKEAKVEEAKPEIWAEWLLYKSTFKEFETVVNKNTGTEEEPILTKEIIASKLKEEFEITNFTIEDGDTIDWHDNPLIGYRMVFADTRIPSTPTDTKIRFLGIDTHESGTVAGRKETKYLNSLIEGKTLTVKINKHFDPERVIGRYGRLLAGIFVDGEDIMVKMLEKFGEDILTATTYQKKYRWIDWDYYKRVAKGETTKGKIKIYSKPSYCNISIDGKNTKKMTIETFELEPAEYKFTLSKFGYADKSETVELLAGEDVELRLELKKTDEDEDDKKDDKDKGKIKIYSKPSYCNISIDDKPMHKLTIETFKLDPGEYKFTISKFGYVDQSETIELKSGDELEKRFELKKTDEADEDEENGEEENGDEKFSIYIDSIPSHAKLFIDGHYTHHLTPSGEKELSDVMHLLKPGEHIIKVTRKGLIAEKVVDIVAGINEDIILELGVLEPEPEPEPEPDEEDEEDEEVPDEEKPKLTLSINSEPSNAKIYIDGVYTKHLTPADEKELSDVAFLLKPGTHKFRFTRSGLGGEQIRYIPAEGHVTIFSLLTIMGLPSADEDVEESIDDKIRGLLAEVEKLQERLSALYLMKG